MAKRERNRGITIRFTEDEKAYFLEQYQKSRLPTQSDFILNLLNEKPIVVIEDLKTVTTELRRQGTNPVSYTHLDVYKRQR